MLVHSRYVSLRTSYQHPLVAAVVPLCVLGGSSLTGEGLVASLPTPLGGWEGLGGDAVVFVVAEKAFHPAQDEPSGRLD